MPRWDTTKGREFMVSLEAEAADTLYNLDNLLTPTQALVRAFVLKGMTNKQIALKLCVVEQGIKDHLTKVYRATQTKNRAELIIKSLKELAANVKNEA